ncbi:M48 family metalloprotease [Marinobacterium sp. xm-d-530]|uniref:M48 family metalloprotease n=1 Tax=Marinobacterium sp. xm-d-530 TaxID=2497747 RepID=UPI00156963F0|nr:M48 family metalloprotease [Marinobacterium sp. xm-d-530]NRQ01005.1 TPR repeat-containing protein YfgC precursor [Marinobacterium sp. xm-d-530]
MRTPLIILLSGLIGLSVQGSEKLPSLAGSTNSSYQLEQERALGQAWMRMMKAQAQLLDDPIVENYLKDRLWYLSPFSELQDKRLDLLVIDQQEVNAFAAPGGIIGINAGLLLATETEDQLMSVIAHELAHLSQRHFAQQQAASEKRQPLVLAGIVGSILLSSINPNAGATALQGTIGASENARLSFSRQNELDADQAGMRTLVAAGYDPQAMPQMFAQLAQANRFSGSAVPEFLRTHPVTESRIADSTNRAMNLPSASTENRDHQNFMIAKSRVAVKYGAENQLLNNSELDESAKHFTHYLKALSVNNNEEAQNHWEALSKSWQQHPWVQLSRLTQLSLSGQATGQLMDELTDLYPNDLAVQAALAKTYREQGNVSQAISLYRKLLRDHPNNTLFLYHLAELYGLINDIEQLHRTRIEFFFQRAEIDLALRQVEFARRDARNNRIQLGWLEQREREIRSDQLRFDELFK